LALIGRLLCFPGKIFERIIANRIQNLYVEQELNNNKQFGFKTGQSAEDALRRIVRMPRIMVQGKRIEFVNEYKYLGVYIDKKLSFLPHVQHLRDKINGCLIKENDPRRVGSEKKSLHIAIQLFILTCKVYGAEAWSHIRISGESSAQSRGSC